MKTALVFPGQGSQSPAMGRAYRRTAAVRRTLEEISDILSTNFAAMADAGEAEEINLTENTQPLMLAMTVGVYRAVADQLPAATMMAGHSLGEYAALVCAEALPFAAAARLVRQRARAMQRASKDGAMAAVIGIGADTVDEVCAQRRQSGDEVWAANYNSPRQTVIAGRRPAVESALDKLKSSGAKRAVMLPLSVPSHCPLMQSAADELSPCLRESPWRRPKTEVLHNVDAQPSRRADDIVEKLSRQLTRPVQWTETVRQMETADVSRVYECGPGAVLRGLVKQISGTIEAAELSGDEAIESLFRTRR